MAPPQAQPHRARRLRRHCAEQPLLPALQLPRLRSRPALASTTASITQNPAVGAALQPRPPRLAPFGGRLHHLRGPYAALAHEQAVTL